MPYQDTVTKTRTMTNEESELAFVKGLRSGKITIDSEGNDDTIEHREDDEIENGANNTAL